MPSYALATEFVPRLTKDLRVDLISLVIVVIGQAQIAIEQFEATIRCHVFDQRRFNV